MSKINPLSAEILDDIWDAGAIKIEETGKFRFKRHEKEPDAPLSPIYFNLRTKENPKPGPLTRQLVKKIAVALRCIAEQYGIFYDTVAGVPNAGDPYAEAMFEMLWAERIYAPLISFVKEENESGRKVARLKPGTVLSQYDDRLLLVDDVVEGAESKFEAISCAEQNGLKIAGVVTLLAYDYSGSDGVDRLELAGYKCAYALKVSEAAAYFYTSETINRAQYDAVMDFLASR